MEPWQSWAIVGVAGAGAYWYYARSKYDNRNRDRTPSSVAPTQRRASEICEDSSKRRKKSKNAFSADRPMSGAADGSLQSMPANGVEKSKKRKGGRQVNISPGEDSNVQNENNSAAGAAFDELEDDQMDNREFAKQLASLKAGTSLLKSAGKSEIKKSRKSGKQNESLPTATNDKLAEPAGGAGSHEMSTTSSTTGADADDDLSPAASPALAAAQATKHAGDIRDMLEVPAKGPSVLRLVQPTQPQVERESKPKKSAPEPETKKQKQRRRKNEEAKAAHEKAEKERRVLMEKQRRTAREAEGRPAKNGIGVSNPLVPNAWKKPSEGEALAIESKGATIDGGGSLLDTFEDNRHPMGNLTKTEVNGTTATQKAWGGDMPSEEEQMRMLSEMDDDGWNTVQKGGKAKKKNNSQAKDLNSDKEGSKAGSYAPEETSSINSNEDELVKNGRIALDNGRAAGNKRNEVEKPTTAHSIGIAPSQSKTTKDQVDPNIWNRDNIHTHPDYDPEFPYALTGHPDDSDWAVV